MRSTFTRRLTGKASATASALSKTSAAPSPEPTAIRTRTGPSASSSAWRDPLARSKRTSWCKRSSVAARSTSTSPAASAATSNAVRPMLKTASSKVIARRTMPRDSSVDVFAVGTHAITAGSKGSGTCTACPAAVATTTTGIDAATLSA